MLETNFTEQVRQEIAALEQQFESSVERGEPTGEFEELALGLARQRACHLSVDRQQALRERHPGAPPGDAAEQAARDGLLTALRTMKAADRDKALDEAIESHDLRTIRAVLGAAAWQSGLSPTKHSTFRQRAHDALIVPIEVDEREARALLVEVLDTRIPEMRAHLVTLAEDRQQAERSSAFKQALGLA